MERLTSLALAAQVAAERHSQELRSVCIDITANCLPDVLVRTSPVCSMQLNLAEILLSLMQLSSAWNHTELLKPVKSGSFVP